MRVKESGGMIRGLIDGLQIKNNNRLLVSQAPSFQHLLLSCRLPTTTRQTNLNLDQNLKPTIAYIESVPHSPLQREPLLSSLKRSILLQVRTIEFLGQLKYFQNDPERDDDEHYCLRHRHHDHHGHGQYHRR